LKGFLLNILNYKDILKEAKKNEMKPVLLPEEIKTVFDPLEGLFYFFLKNKRNKLL